MGNADTIQQRARFFGYRDAYLGYCRIFLTGDAREAYRSYVEHEEDIREQMKKFGQTGRSLSEWRRSFFLSEQFRPTRDAVLDLDYIRVNISDEWFTPKSPHVPEEAIVANSAAVRDFLDRLNFVDAVGHPDRTEYQRHQVATGVPLRESLDILLSRFQLGRPEDSQQFTGLLVQIDRYLRAHPNETCSVYLMSGGKARMRQLNTSDAIDQLFQGANPKDGSIYPGDRGIQAAQDLLTIQLHFLRLKPSSGDPIENVPTVALWLPKKMAAPIIVQEEAAATHG